MRAFPPEGVIMVHERVSVVSQEVGEDFRVAAVSQEEAEASEVEVPVGVGNRSSEPILFFSKKEKEQIAAVIREVEKKTSGEIRVHLARRTQEDILVHAKEIFEKIGMTNTKTRNGVLIFLNVKSRRFAVIGDVGIHEKVPEGLWDEMAQTMTEHFKKNRFADGIVEAVRLIGEKLREYFPHERDDINELPDEISYS